VIKSKKEAFKFSNLSLKNMKKMETSSYIESLPLAQDVKRRISMTVSCEDCSYIKKVVNAGKTFSTNDFSYQVMHNGLKIIEGGYHGRAITEIIRP